MEKGVVLYELQLQLAVVAANRFCEGGESDMEDDDRWSTTWNGMSATLASDTTRMSNIISQHKNSLQFCY